MRNPGSVTVVGLGYVGLPLALAFSDVVPTTGFDVDSSRVSQLSNGIDRNGEVDTDTLSRSNMQLVDDESCITDAEFIVVTVPTPVGENHEPDLSLLESASALIGSQLRQRKDGMAPPFIVFESTTYPGCTEGFCAPIIERESGLVSGSGFYLGYSPERTNFGDKEHTLETVVKVVSGQSPEVTDVVASTYSLIAKAGVHPTVDILTAEASKVIENVQRDLNIALFNELAMVFDRMNITSSDVFDAAATKWNFHRYQPGLVGGHCIPVDPYYLTYVAEQHGYKPNVILGGRETNESMVGFVLGKISSLAASSQIDPANSRVLVLGQTFKKDVADVRNSKAVELTKSLADVFSSVNSYDPFLLSPDDDGTFGANTKYDIVVVAVAHSEFLDSAFGVTELVREAGILVDLTGEIKVPHRFPSESVYWTP